MPPSRRSAWYQLAFAVLRRKPDWLLIYFAVFAILYGLRLWICSPLLAMAEQGATFYIRLRGAVNYVILIPTFLFFICLGLPRRFERAVAYTMVALGCMLAASTFLFGDSRLYQRTDSIAIISASAFFLVRFMWKGSRPGDADFLVIRWGLLIFIAFVLWQNLAGFFSTSLPLLEPFGFAAFLSVLDMLLRVVRCGGTNS